MYFRLGINSAHRLRQCIFSRSLDKTKKLEVLQFERALFGINESLFQAELVSQKHTEKHQELVSLALETDLELTCKDDAMDSKSDISTKIALHEELSKLWENVKIHTKNCYQILQKFWAKVNLDLEILISVSTLVKKLTKTHSPLSQTIQQK